MEFIARHSRLFLASLGRCYRTRLLRENGDEREKGTVSLPLKVLFPFKKCNNERSDPL